MDTYYGLIGSQLGIQQNSQSARWTFGIIISYYLHNHLHNYLHNHLHNYLHKYTFSILLSRLPIYSRYNIRGHLYLALCLINGYPEFELYSRYNGREVFIYSSDDSVKLYVELLSRHDMASFHDMALFHVILIWLRSMIWLCSMWYWFDKVAFCYSILK